MPSSAGTSGGLLKTHAIKITHNDFLSDTSTDNQTVTILDNTGTADAQNILVFDSSIHVPDVTGGPWSGGTVTCAVGTTSDADGFNAAFTMSAQGTDHNTGAFLSYQNQTVTTVGANTGTSGAGLSLIPAAKSGGLIDDDSAATNGTAVNVVPETNGITAYLESTLAGNADTTFEIVDSGPVVFVNDNDTPGGVQLYFDEDAAATDSRFLAVSPTGADLFVPSTTGDCIRVVHDASAATNGVAVYIDDDAGSASQKLLFVSPTNASGSYTADDEFALNTQGGVLMNDFVALQEDLAALNSELLGGPSSFTPYGLNIGASGLAVSATLTTDTAWSTFSDGVCYVVLAYIDFSILK